MDLHERIRAARKARGLKQVEVADHFGIKPVSVTQWESGKSRPDQAKMAPLARLLGVNLPWLIEESGEPGIDLKAIVRVSLPPVRPPDELRPEATRRGRADFKIFGTAEGGAGAVILSSDPIESREWPDVLVGILSWLGIIEGRVAYAVLVLVVVVALQKGISEWEQRSKETHERLVRLQVEVQRIKEVTLNIEAHMVRMSRQSEEK